MSFDSQYKDSGYIDAQYKEGHYRAPRLMVIAGPNGSGKSTVTKGLPLVGIYVNADEIKKSAGCSDLEAAKEAEAIRRSLVRKFYSFQEMA